MMKSTCDRCGDKCGWFNLTDIKPIYRVGGIVDVCRSCANKANSFVNYYGKKTEKDKQNLSCFLMSGKLVLERFNQIMYAGYK